MPGSLFAQKSGQVIWFDTPNPSVSVSVWGDGEVPVTAGSFGANKDRAWEHTSLPVGNGSIGANIMGSVSVERFTFNEKTLWRGGPRTVKNAASYWNVNKESAHVLKDIRQAFADGNSGKSNSAYAGQFLTVKYLMKRMRKSLSVSEVLLLAENSGFRQDLMNRNIPDIHVLCRSTRLW